MKRFIILALVVCGVAASAPVAANASWCLGIGLNC